MRKLKGFITIFVSIVLVFVPVMDIYATGIKEAQDEKAALEKELSEAQNLIDGLKNSKDDMQEKVRQLDKKLTDISGRINDLQTQLEQKNSEIASTKEQLSHAINEESIQYERMKIRIKYMYENSSTMSVLESLFSSGSLADFINQAEYVRKIMKYDREMLARYQDTQKAVADNKQILESDYADLASMKEQVKKEQDAVQALLTAKQEELENVSGEITNAQESADVVAAEIQAQDDIIAQIQAEEARKAAEKKAAEEAAERAKAEEQAAQQNAGNTNNEQQEQQQQQQEEQQQETPEVPGDTYGGGVFTWPCPSSTRVTSDYGSRLSPTTGASSNHKGIDIGADYGAAIVAAADGTVTYAGYANATGNYVMVSHGSGIYTIYCHCSALLVSTGQTVSKGQTIAQIGSTGISTGNHLHFGVSENGSYVSPWNYLSR